MQVMKSLSDGIEKLRSNPIIAALVLIIAVVTAVASFTDSVSKIAELFPRSGGEAARADLSRLGIPFTAASLQQKARDGDLIAVEKLLQAGMPADAISENDESDNENLPALAEAAARGDVAMVRTLLAKHADPSAAVKAAAAHGHTEVLQMLLKQQASEDAIREALVSAAYNMKLDDVRVLAAQLADPKPAVSWALWVMSQSNGWGDKDMIALDRTLFQLGADPNLADEDGITPLMVAANGNSVAQVAMLLEAGASANARCVCPNYSNGGWTALGLAARKGDADKTIRLIAAGADVNIRNAEGDTPLILATRRPSLEAVKALLEAGADVTARGRNGDRAIDIAARGYVWPDQTVYHPKLVELLSSYDGKR
jgi:ankyrin repeat protein